MMSVVKGEVDVQDVSNDKLDYHSRESQRSDDSFSAYIEHPLVRESTPPQRKQQTEHQQESARVQELSRLEPIQSTVVRDTSSMDVDEAEAEEGDESWPSIIDHEQEDGQDSNVSQSSIHIPDLQEQDEDEGELEVGGEKKRRRRTNKAEASVLASV
jgi:hypothetical protein